MASATSGVSKITTGTSVRNRRSSYYKTEVTENADGSLKSTLYRTDAQGNNAVALQNTTVTKDGKRTVTTTSDASAAEKRALSNPESSLSKARSGQVKDVEKKLHPEGASQEQKSNADKSGGGTGNEAPESEEQAGDSSQPAADQPSSSGDNIGRQSFPNLVYPIGLGQSKQDIIKFNMVKYEPKDFQGVGFADRSEASKRTIGSVVLPIPSGIKDTNSVQWGSENMNPVEAAAAAVALGFIGGGTEGASGAVESVFAGVSQGKEDVKAALTAAFAGSATGTGAQLLTRTTGAVINPNMELLFKGPSLRPFNFTFKLAPRSKEEAQEVIKIIRFFKQGMSPIKTPSNIFLKSPHTFLIQYKHRGGDEHPYIGKIKECALQSFDVDYTPEANYATFSDGVMTSYQITMTFQELEPVFNNDYTDLDNDADTQIGF